jgi:hypothetical protein
MNEAVRDNAFGIGPDFRSNWRRVAGPDGGQDNHPFVLKAPIGIDPRQSVLLTRGRVRAAESLMPRVALPPPAPTLRPATAVPLAPIEIDEPPIVRPRVQTLLGRWDGTRRG